MDKKRQTIAGRVSFAPMSKTPTRPRLTMNSHTPSKSAPRFSLGCPQTGTKGSISRLSVFKAPATNGQPKDTGDRATQQRMVRKIYNFLANRDGEDQIPSESNIARPSSNDFISIFEKMYECLSPNYEFTREKKLTDEIPRIFSALGYPYVIKAATLQTVGAPHSWHYLLHALCWLIDFISKSESIDVGSQILLSGDEGNGHVAAFRMSWKMKHFHEFQKNPNIIDYKNYLEGSAREIRDFYENNENIQGQIQSAEMNLKSIRAEIDEFAADVGVEGQLKEDIRKTEEDLKKTSIYVESLDSHVATTSTAAEEAAADSREIKNTVENLKAEVQRKKEAVAEQERSRGIKGDQAKAIMSEYNQLTRQLRETRADIEQLSKEAWLTQPKVNDLFAQSMGRFRKTLQQLRSIASEVGYTMHIDESSLRYPKDIATMIQNEVRDEMEAIRGHMEAIQAATDKEIKGLEMKRGHIENRCQVEEEKLVDVARRLQRKRLSYAQFAEQAKEERRNEQITIEKIENEKDLLLKRQRGVAALQHQLQLAREDMEETVRRAEAIKADIENETRANVTAANEALQKIKHEREILATLKTELIERRTLKFKN